MAIEIEETFQVGAPVARVWRFMLDPHQIVTCMPGAELEEVVDDRNFRGAVKVRLGAISARYQGRVELTEVDAEAHTVRMLAEGRETGGGTAKGSLRCRLRDLPDGRTEVVTAVRVDLTGRVMQVGRGMIQGVSRQLFGQFAARTAESLEKSQEVGEVAIAREEPIRLLPLLLGAAWAPVVRFFRRLFRRPAVGEEIQ